MTIYIKDGYQEQRELTIDQANFELHNGTLSTSALAWKPGSEEWIPVLSLDGIHPPLPPPFPGSSSPQPCINAQRVNCQADRKRFSILTAKWTLPRILTAIGVLVAYLILISTVFSAGVHPGKNEYGPLWAAICSIALFRRMLRLRSEGAILKRPHLNAINHYWSSLYSAFWRWLLVFVGILALQCFSIESAEEAGRAVGSTFVFITIGMFFALDIPYRVFRAYSKHHDKAFQKTRIGWIVFLAGIFLMLIFHFTASPPSSASHQESGNSAILEQYISPDKVWTVDFPGKCNIKSVPLYNGNVTALRTIYSVKKSESQYFSVETVEYPKTYLNNLERAPSLAGAVDGALSSTGGSLLFEQDISSNGIQGKEVGILSKSKRFYITSRVFLKNDILYSAIAASNKDADPDSINFLKSFAFK